MREGATVINYGVNNAIFLRGTKSLTSGRILAGSLFVNTDTNYSLLPIENALPMRSPML